MNGPLPAGKIRGKIRMACWSRRRELLAHPFDHHTAPGVPGSASFQIITVAVA
jgi:hypothetical protein